MKRPEHHDLSCMATTERKIVNYKVTGISRETVVAYGVPQIKYLAVMVDLFMNYVRHPSRRS